jgi:hypothetical protein
MGRAPIVDYTTSTHGSTSLVDGAAPRSGGMTKDATH